MKLRYGDLAWPGPYPADRPRPYMVTGVYKSRDDRWLVALMGSAGSRCTVPLHEVTKVARVGNGEYEPYKDVELLDRELWQLLNSPPDEIPSYLKTKLRRLCYAEEGVTDELDAG